MRIFKTRVFAKFADKKSISDQNLIKAVERAEKGLIDADLGGNVIKQRIARQSTGKSSGYRVLILYQIHQNHYFIAAFDKSSRANISSSDEQALKLLAKQYLGYSEQQITDLVNSRVLIEIERKNNDL